MIDWVVVGGESGPGARSMNPEWVRAIRDQCQEADVSFFFKQWGRWMPFEMDAQPPFYTSQHGNMIDGHGLPDLIDHEPVNGWWWPDGMSHTIYYRLGKKASGRLLDGRTWDEYPNREPVAP